MRYISEYEYTVYESLELATLANMTTK